MDIKMLEMGFSRQNATNLLSGEPFDCNITMTNDRMLLLPNQTEKLNKLLKEVSEILADGFYQMAEQKIKDKEVE